MTINFSTALAWIKAKGISITKMLFNSQNCYNTMAIVLLADIVSKGKLGIINYLQGVMTSISGVKGFDSNQLLILIVVALIFVNKK